MKKYGSVYELEKELSKLPQLDEDLNHHFMGGVYIRELKIPRGALIIGKRHRHKTCNILMKGKMAVYSEETGQAEIIEGPLAFESQPMVKKMAYCFEECIFMNIHPTEETDLKKVEDIFIIPEEEYLLTVMKGGPELCHGEL